MKTAQDKTMTVRDGGATCFKVRGKQQLEDPRLGSSHSREGGDIKYKDLSGTSLRPRKLVFDLDYAVNRREEACQ